jgi:hypothetical protein
LVFLSQLKGAGRTCVIPKAEFFNVPNRFWKLVNDQETSHKLNVIAAKAAIKIPAVVSTPRLAGLVTM